MISEKFAEGAAHSWACAGWQIALSIDNVAIAASTGTYQRTFTPEKPPTMTKSPVPGTDERVRELLTFSLELTESDIENTTSCER
jgi:hypothetical protein